MRLREEAWQDTERKCSTIPGPHAFAHLPQGLVITLRACQPGCGEGGWAAPFLTAGYFLSGHYLLEMLSFQSVLSRYV